MNLIIFILNSVPFIGFIFSIISLIPLFPVFPSCQRKRNCLRFLNGFLFFFLAYGDLYRGLTIGSSFDCIFAVTFAVLSVAWFVIAFLFQGLDVEMIKLREMRDHNNTVLLQLENVERELRRLAEQEGMELK